MAIEAYSKGWMTFYLASYFFSGTRPRQCANWRLFCRCKTARQKSSLEIYERAGQTVRRNFNVLQIEFKISPTTQFWVFFQWSRQIMTGKQKAARLSPPKLSGTNKQTTNKIKLNWTNARFLDLNLWRKNLSFQSYSGCRRTVGSLRGEEVTDGEPGVLLGPGGAAPGTLQVL